MLFSFYFLRVSSMEDSFWANWYEEMLRLIYPCYDFIFLSVLIIKFRRGNIVFGYFMFVEKRTPTMFSISITFEQQSKIVKFNFQEKDVVRWVLFQNLQDSWSVYDGWWMQMCEYPTNSLVVLWIRPLDLRIESRACGSS